MKDQYRIREYKGRFTIEKKRIIKQFRLMLPDKIAESWEVVDENGDFIFMPELSEMLGEYPRYTTLDQATTAMNQLIEGVKYHYSNESELDKIVKSLPSIN
jgi:hypothetical protein